MTDPTTAWVEENQRTLMAAVATVRQHLERHAGGSGRPAGPEIRARDTEEPFALETVVGTFGLSGYVSGSMCWIDGTSYGLPLTNSLLSFT